MFTDFLTGMGSPDLNGFAAATYDKDINLDSFRFIDCLEGIEKDGMSPLLRDASCVTKDQHENSQTMASPNIFLKDEILKYVNNESLKEEADNSHYKLSGRNEVDPDLQKNTANRLKVKTGSCEINRDYAEMLTSADDHRVPVLFKQLGLDTGNYAGILSETFQRSSRVRDDINLKTTDKILQESFEGSNLDKKDLSESTSKSLEGYSEKIKSIKISSTFILPNTNKDHRIKSLGDNNSFSKSNLLPEENAVLKQNILINVIDQSIKNRIDDKTFSNRINSFNGNEHGAAGNLQSSLMQYKSSSNKIENVERITVAGEINIVDLIKVDDPNSGLSSRGSSKISDTLFSALENRSMEKPLKNEILSQIIDKAIITLKDGHNEIRINLKPEIFGHLHLNITTDNNQITAKILSEFPFVKEIIESNIGQLKSALQVHGFDADQINVSVTDDYNQYNGYSRRHSFNNSQYNDEDMAGDPNTIEEESEIKQITDEPTGGLKSDVCLSIRSRNYEYKRIFRVPAQRTRQR